MVRNLCLVLIMMLVLTFPLQALESESKDTESVISGANRWSSIAISSDGSKLAALAWSGR